MFFCKLILFALVSLILRCSGASYVYPLWSSEDRKIENAESCQRDATVTEFVLEVFVIPIKDVFCIIWANFSQVYYCILEYLEQFREKAPKESPSFLGRILHFFGLAETRTAKPQSCCYYSVMVVSITIFVFITTILVAKKLMEYVKEEDDRLFSHMLPNYNNKRPLLKR